MESTAPAVARRTLREPGRGRQAAANACYLAAARVLAALIGRHQVVRSVFLRRSGAAGDVQFGRSDIDLGIVLHGPCAEAAEARRLFALNRTVRRLRAVFPWLGQCEVHAAVELPDWTRRESFRVALDRENGVLLHGDPVELPSLPITAAQAAYRTAFWFEHYLPLAARAGHRCNLWKFALEMWTTVNIGLGRISVPCGRRADILASWREREPGAPLPSPAWPPDRLWRLTMTLASDLRAAMLAPLGAPASPIVIPLVLPPSFARRTLLVGTADQLADLLPRMAADALPMTPDALGLYIEYVNPAAFARLPPAVRSLGCQPPSPEAWREALLRWSCPLLARKPGFGLRGFGTGPRQVLYAERAAAAWRAGSDSGSIALEDLGPAARTSLGFREYFLDYYPQVLAAARATRMIFEA